MDDRKFIEKFDKQQKSKKHKRSKDSGESSNTKTKQPKKEPEPSINLSALYRDRAKERRDGVNTDFELDPDDLRISNPVLESAIPDEDGQIVDEDERRRQQIEESKYLGGDVEHTHLVKGLDFALLEKVKNDQKFADKLANQDNKRDMSFGALNSDSEEEEFINEAIIAASSKRQLADIEKLKSGQSTELVHCRTAIARRILNVLDERWPDKSELYLPGRMSYTIPLADDCEDETVTTILRSKADTMSHDDGGLPNETDFALDQLVNILARVRQSGSSVGASKKTRDLDRDLESTDYGY